MTRAAALVGLLLAAALQPASAQSPAECYQVETIATPPGGSAEVSALAFAGGGRLYAAFRLGSIWSRDAGGEWRNFAGGLFWPLGILPGRPGELFVAQVPELTRVADEDGDGVAETYETVCDAWGLSGNYHEFVSGPVRDAEGNFYVALGLASTNGPVRPPARGPLREPRGRTSGHHSPARWRGWVLRIAPGGAVEPFASGFRQPHGIVLDPAGDLFVADNQGDWVGTSPLHHVRRGDFCGHPAGLAWEPGFEGDPFAIPIERLAARRKPPALLFPQHDLAGSIGQPLFDLTGGKFGPYAGQLFVPDWQHPRIHRVFLERIDGVYQGACFPFLDGGGLRRGSHRLAFAPDGSLWAGQVSRLWGGSGEGLQRIVWSGRAPLDILAMRLLDDGFELEFTQPIDAAGAADPESYSMTRYHYRYHPEYGSPKEDETPIPIARAEVAPDARRVRLRLGAPLEGKVYELRPHGLRGRDGATLETRLGAYTVNRRR